MKTIKTQCHWTETDKDAEQASGNGGGGCYGGEDVGGELVVAGADPPGISSCDDPPSEMNERIASTFQEPYSFGWRGVCGRTNMLKLTGTDIRIAQLLEENARLSNTEIATAVGYPPLRPTSR